MIESHNNKGECTVRKTVNNNKGKNAMKNEGQFASTSAYRVLPMYGFTRRAYIKHVKWSNWYRPEHAMPTLVVRQFPVRTPRKRVLIKRTIHPAILALMYKKAA
jgi:hypothetical protein